MERNSSLNKIRAQIKSAVFQICDQQIHNKDIHLIDNSKQTDDNLLINQLIREYFKFNNYNYSLTIFETGLYSIIILFYNLFHIFVELLIINFKLILILFCI
jgi:hypothetical protein